MPEYRTRLFDADDLIELPAPTIKARGWSAELRGLYLTGSQKDVSKKARAAHYRTIIGFSEGKRSRVEFTYAPEIILSAQSRQKAQRALNLISAATAVYFAQSQFDEFVAVPCDQGKPEGLLPHQLNQALGTSICTNGLWKATEIAGRLTRRTNWKFAAAKYFTSLRVASVHPMEHHPNNGSHYGVESDPIQIVNMAEAIILAYSAIEELDLEVRASREKPSKIDGRWNPPVLQDLLDRLRVD